MTDDTDPRRSGPPPGDHSLQISDLDSQEIDLSDLRWQDGLVLAIFWILALVVFLQFFTRYVLNDSLGWTEEIARYLLIGVTFAGSVMAARKNCHIAVEFLYRWVPRPLRRVMQTVIDLITTGFFAALAGLSVQLAGRTGQMMVSIDVPKSWVYWFVAACFAAMAVHAAINMWRHLSSGTSRLIDPELHADDVRAID
ncbi:TRAP transporter small permease [Salipiger marinus]|jgi:TRAP-type C4-dicarboxylate transport system permease small subunit|uniref:TRAP transporter small permease protein n=1 Tax=Salipiger marinus TaxID=555512 RepID=A0A1G8RQH3_9RHOB|nr:MULTISPECIES: TRAP transporter small permease [Salipiger]MCD1620318.1 TRAP transporter small permease [Salipiger manganoxidans]MEB3421030.1 TRAP transporter small permease [Salipiger manganoxidans]SDJ19217.1 TRAP-type C4-dicarboxylate transport system, small permease component [Salipiger marinus]HBM60146.1 TRAP transporter small permease [Citreicella sp.]